jgi:hypothetical protein
MLVVPCVKYDEQGAYNCSSAKGAKFDIKTDLKDKGVTFVHSELFSHGPFYVLYGCEFPDTLVFPSYMEYFELDIDSKEFKAKVISDSGREALYKKFNEGSTNQFSTQQRVVDKPKELACYMRFDNDDPVLVAGGITDKFVLELMTERDDLGAGEISFSSGGKKFTLFLADPENIKDDHRKSE